MADPVVTEVKTAVSAEAVTVKAKVVAFAQAHYSKAVSAAVGFGTAKLGIIGFIWKVL